MGQKNHQVIVNFQDSHILRISGIKQRPGLRTQHDNAPQQGEMVFSHNGTTESTSCLLQ